MKEWIYIAAMAIIMTFGTVIGIAICCFFIDLIFGFRIGLSSPPLILYIMIPIGSISFIGYLLYYYNEEFGIRNMKMDDILKMVVINAIMIFAGWGAYNHFFKNDNTPIQQEQGQYSLEDYRKQREEIKKAEEECLQIVGDYLKRYGYNVTYIYTTNVQLTDWKYNIKGQSPDDWVDLF